MLTTSSLPSWIRLAGQRPFCSGLSNSSRSPSCCVPPARAPDFAVHFPWGVALALSASESYSTRHPSMLIAPVPQRNTFAATVPSIGFRATQIGSCAGFRAVLNPSYSFLSLPHRAQQPLLGNARPSNAPDESRKFSDCGVCCSLGSNRGDALPPARSTVAPASSPQPGCALKHNRSVVLSDDSVCVSSRNLSPARCICPLSKQGCFPPPISDSVPSGQRHGLVCP
jgi:hypothetical protein